MKNNKSNVFKKNAYYSAFAVTFMMLIFKAFGFIKQSFIAYYFGTSLESDSYFIASGFVNGISEVIVKSISFSIIPIYTSILLREGKEKANRVISGVFEILFPIFVIIIALLCFFAPAISSLLAPNYDVHSHNLIASYICWLSPIMIFCMIELILGSILDANKEFFVSRLQSFLYSICIIFMCVFFANTLGIKSLAFGQYLSSILYTFILIIFIRKYWHFSFVKISNYPELKEIIIKSLPLFIGYGVLQINQIIDKSIATSLGVGSASALSYCHILEQFVTNIMIVNIGNVLFAHFSEYVVNSDYNKLSTTLNNSINILICLLIPISIITLFYSKDIVSIVYYRGNFNNKSLLLTSTVLIGYAISFLFVGIRDLIIKCLYSFKNTFVPMISSIVSIIINICLSIYLSKKIGIIGISIATSISALIGMIINCIVFKRKYNIYSYNKNILTFIQNIPGVIILVLFIILINRFVPTIYGFAISASLGLIIYFIMLILFKVQVASTVLNKILRKIGIENV